MLLRATPAGARATAHYEIVSTGTTGHAESVQVTFDPSEVSFGQLLKIYFSIAHDPTELNHQGPDEGTQYRSEIFYTSDEQKRIADAYIQQLTEAKVFRHKIVTKVAPLQAFYRAEDYHQNYVLHCRQNSPVCTNKPYVVYNDLPKLTNLRADLSGTGERRLTAMHRRVFLNAIGIGVPAAAAVGALSGFRNLWEKAIRTHRRIRCQRRPHRRG